MTPELFQWHAQVWCSLIHPPAQASGVILPKGYEQTKERRDQPTMQAGHGDAVVDAFHERYAQFHHRQDLVAALLQSEGPEGSKTAAAITTSRQLLGNLYPMRLSGKSLGAGKEGPLKVVPMHLRSHFLIWIEIFHRIVKPAPQPPIEDPEALVAFLDGAGGVLALLGEALYLEGGEVLREEYERPKKPSKKAKLKQ